MPPRNARTTSRATRNGNAKKTSVTRIMMSSNRPPYSPATDPTVTPMMVEKIAAARPITSETRKPAMSRLYRSRPMSSVPSQATWRGDRYWFGPSLIGNTASFTSYRIVHGARITITNKMAMMTVQTTAPLCRM